MGLKHPKVAAFDAVLGMPPERGIMASMRTLKDPRHARLREAADEKARLLFKQLRANVDDLRPPAVALAWTQYDKALKAEIDYELDLEEKAEEANATTSRAGVSRQSLDRAGE
jgi:hypothetical protein